MTDAAGAVADGTLAQRARADGMDPDDALRRNDSGTLFERVGGSIRTGASGTNVMDVIAAAFGPLH